MWIWFGISSPPGSQLFPLCMFDHVEHIFYTHGLSGLFTGFSSLRDKFWKVKTLPVHSNMHCYVWNDSSTTLFLPLVFNSLPAWTQNVAIIFSGWLCHSSLYLMHQFFWIFFCGNVFLRVRPVSPAFEPHFFSKVSGLLRKYFKKWDRILCFFWVCHKWEILKKYFFDFSRTKFWFFDLSPEPAHFGNKNRKHSHLLDLKKGNIFGCIVFQRPNWPFDPSSQNLDTQDPQRLQTGALALIISVVDHGVGFAIVVPIKTNIFSFFLICGTSKNYQKNDSHFGQKIGFQI